jgi:hypothetical protein
MRPPARRILAALVAVAGLRFRPSVTLRPDRVEIAAAPDTIIELLQARFRDGPDVVVASEDRLVRRFAGRAGLFPYRTTELIAFAPDGVTFDHLAGPFATCHERFHIHPHGATTTLEHTGDFALRGGLWTFALFAAPVRNAFEAHVRHHLHQLAAELADHE